eukprot:CAMPEP_0119540628 /NCGR_PEP_ID=MMETSP1344-20130328/52455_1 /TAXON_ID=236787 /ORGANISM="Florenciella parvula, Strain CCMP2471" /LENGTH=147 /DNA_ID=CAMNT_0007584425 /DNA_START=467 /DNA_END=908 /DNA_ORIENTATION=-
MRADVRPLASLFLALMPLPAVWANARSAAIFALVPNAPMRAIPAPPLSTILGPAFFALLLLFIMLAQVLPRLSPEPPPLAAALGKHDDLIFDPIAFDIVRFATIAVSAASGAGAGAGEISAVTVGGGERAGGGLSANRTCCWWARLA